MKNILIMLLAALAVFSVSAADIGVNIDNFTTYNQDNADADPIWEQKNKVSLWAEHSWFGTNKKYFTLSGQGIYVYTDTRPYLFDIERLVFKGKIPAAGKVYDFSAGRFFMRDLNPTVWSRTADGAVLSADMGKMTVSASAAYTGLQLKPDYGVEMTASDTADLEDDEVYFAPKRAVENLSLSFPGLFAGNTLAVSLLAQQDLRSGSDALSTVHATAALSGGIGIPGFYFSASGTGSLAAYGNEYDFSSDFVSWMAAANISYFNQKFMFSKIGAGAVYAAEDFIVVSTPSFGMINSLNADNIIVINADYSFKPFGDRMSPLARNMMIAVDAKAFFDTEFTYSGTEAGGGITLRPASDFGLSLKGAAWFPEGGDMELLCRLEASLGF